MPSFTRSNKRKKLPFDIMSDFRKPLTDNQICSDESEKHNLISNIRKKLECISNVSHREKICLDRCFRPCKTQAILFSFKNALAKGLIICIYTLAVLNNLSSVRDRRWSSCEDAELICAIVVCICKKKLFLFS